MVRPQGVETEDEAAVEAEEKEDESGGVDGLSK